jgi:hypothetical protein
LPAARLGLGEECRSSAATKEFWRGLLVWIHPSCRIDWIMYFFQIRNAKNVQEKLQHEIYYSDFERYRKQRFDEQQKENDEWLKKHSNE